MKRVIFSILSFAFYAATFLSCQKEKPDQVKQEGQVEISFSTSQMKSFLKSASDSGYIQGLTNIVISIEDLNGTLVKSSEKIELYNMNGYYISKPISLLTGEYRLTKFLVLDAKNNVVYASPLSGSPKAYLVQQPLPLVFSTKKDVVTKLTPEVLSTADSRPEDFGYVTFNFEISKSFDILVGAFVYNAAESNYKLTDASISVYSDSSFVYKSLLSDSASTSNLSVYDTLGITNKISLPERYNSFTIKISKLGYKTYEKTFTKEELRLYYRSEDKGPLVVILEKSGEVPNPNTVTDIDGNVYQTVIIGNQTWMKENLKVTKYRNGDLIGTTATTSMPLCDSLSTKYQWAYNGNENNVSVCGRLYTWYVVNDNRGLCPTGWHIPTEIEWTTLTDYLINNAYGYGGDGNDIGKSIASKSGWYEYNNSIVGTVGNDQTNNNKSGFNAFPTGLRDCGGGYNFLTNTAYWWSSSEYSATHAMYRSIDSGSPYVYKSNYYKKGGQAVRCLKD